MRERFPGTAATDGRALRPASLLRKGAALAVDLSLTVGVASFAFYLISTAIPLDTAAAKPWLTAVMLVAMVYLAWGRDRLPSAGRHIFGLEVVPAPGPVPGFFGRTVSVHADDGPRDEGGETRRAIAVVALSTALSGFSLASTLSGTTVFQAVLAHTERTQPLAAESGGAPELSALPRALLVGQRRAYVQVGARWPARSGVLEFFLQREGDGRWSVEAVRETKPSMFANYSLGVADRDVPAAPVGATDAG